MPRALWLADVLKDAGLTVHTYTGWETRGRDDFTPKGIVWHHTVTRPTTSDEVVDRMLAVAGSSTVPAPLANYSTNRDGTVSVIAAGTANHAGVGTWKGLSHSRYFVGDEMKNYGTPEREPWMPRQLESARIAAAAILTHLESDAGYLVAHREYATPPGRKTDPHSLSMPDERVRVAALMEGADMPTAKEIADEVWLHTTIPDAEASGQRTHMSDAVKRIWRAALDDGTLSLTPAQVDAIAVSVAGKVSDQVSDRVAEAVADMLAERLRD